MDEEQQAKTPSKNLASQASSQIDRKFYIITTSLLMLIIILLAGLWLKMRWRAIQAERRFARVQPLLQRQSALEKISKSLLQNPPVITIERENLQQKKVLLNGKDIDALLLPESIARWMDFRPGDVIIVEKTDLPASARQAGSPSTRATSQPASKPSGE